MPRSAASPRLLIRSSSIHAAGCYTLDPIPRGTRIAEYDGPRITKALADERYADRPVTYLFGCGDNGDVIDGFGTAMFLNHSCAPNCETSEVNRRIYIRALRDIAAGEELLYEYNLYDSDDDDADCYCGAPQCRGTMFSDEEVQRQARRKARLKAKKAAERAAKRSAKR
jgi:SET domain-containing protein